jgi:hypothetical protein
MRSAWLVAAWAVLAGMGPASAIPPPAPGAACAAGVIDAWEPSSGETIYLGYAPPAIENLLVLPAHVRERLDGYLTARLGQDQLRKLHFHGGRTIDRDAAIAAYPGTVDFQWELPAYELAFRYERPEAGVRSFLVGLRLRADGTPIEDLPLPAFASEPARRAIVPFAQACKTAAAQGFAESEVDLVYSKERGALFWRFRRVVHDKKWVIEYEELELDAHTGSFLRRVPNTGFR